MGVKQRTRARSHSSEAAELYAIAERHRTIRLTVITFGVVFSLGIIATAVVMIADKPWWQALIGTIISAVITIVGGQGVLSTFLRRRFARYTKRTQGRVAELEKERDPARSSSGLLTHRSDPPEDL